MAVEIPKDLLASLQGVPGFAERDFAEAHASGEQVVSIRLNPSKVADASQLNSLQPYLAEKVPWNSHGYYLNARPSFTIDPLFHAGAYYVQEASSMFLEVALRQSCELNSPLRVLDLCAAPGGKSTLIQSLLSSESLLVSNEVIKSRANILAENLTKWGAANVIVTNNDPKDFKRLPSFFDCIVVDAPCSGSGLFRKDADAVAEWSLNNVALCSQRQQRILADVMNALKPGGILVYSTCSYSTDEDEFISDWLADNHAVQSLRLQLREDWNIVETTSEKHNHFGYRFYPDKLKGEGFFIAVFKKQGEISVPRADKRNLAKNTTPSRLEEAIAAPYIVAPTLVTIMKWQSDLLAIPKVAYDSVLQLQQNMYIKKAGVNFGTVIRQELIPSHELVISTIYSGNIPELEVDQETALNYLRRKDINMDTFIHGWAVVTYLSVRIGLVKILPNRINNYYPKDWRILNK